jgi:hypothetical protein
MDVGANVPVTVQKPPIGIGVVQSFIWLNSEAFKPVMLMSVMSRSETPVFETVTVLGKDVLPTSTVPRLTEEGRVEILGGEAVPEIFTFMIGFLGSLEEILRTAVLGPKGGDGLKVIVTVHEPPGGIVVQSFV